MKLIEIKKAKKVIFVGDTHGDLEASQKVIKDYLKGGNKIVFLGDYVDRGPFSKENLDFLLKVKKENPERVYLLQGNHEGHRVLKCFPAEFWEGLDKKDYEKYGSIVEKFPLAVIFGKIVALHGTLPDIKNLKEINKITLGKKDWQHIVWGDFLETTPTCHPPSFGGPLGEYLGIDLFSGRPQFGRDYFFRMMKRFNKEILIRSHQPDAPQFMFNDRCLTIFTSSAYTRERTIAIADFTKEMKTARDLEIKKI